MLSLFIFIKTLLSICILNHNNLTDLHLDLLIVMQYKVLENKIENKDI